ncbi:11644_t:CDS:1, partial [Acaulospora morrowiae]
DNQSAKWELEGLFILDFVASCYIIEAEAQELLRKQKKIEFIGDEDRAEMEDSDKLLIESDGKKFMSED